MNVNIEDSGRVTLILISVTLAFEPLPATFEHQWLQNPLPTTVDPRNDHLTSTDLQLPSEFGQDSSLYLTSRANLISISKGQPCLTSISYTSLHTPDLTLKPARLSTQPY